MIEKLNKGNINNEINVKEPNYERHSINHVLKQLSCMKDERLLDLSRLMARHLDYLEKLSRSLSRQLLLLNQRSRRRTGRARMRNLLQEEEDFPLASDEDMTKINYQIRKEFSIELNGMFSARMLLRLPDEVFCDNPEVYCHWEIEDINVLNQTPADSIELCSLHQQIQSLDWQLDTAISSGTTDPIDPDTERAVNNVSKIYFFGHYLDISVEIQQRFVQEVVDLAAASNEGRRLKTLALEFNLRQRQRRRWRQVLVLAVWPAGHPPDWRPTLLNDSVGYYYSETDELFSPDAAERLMERLG